MFGGVVLYKSEVYSIFFHPTYRKINLAHYYILEFICAVLSVLMNVKSTFQLSCLLILHEFTQYKMDI